MTRYPLKNLFTVISLSLGLILFLSLVASLRATVPSSNPPALTAVPTLVPTATPIPTPRPKAVVAETGEPMICYPAPVDGVLHPMFCGTPNMSYPYWCNPILYPAPSNPYPAVCGYINQPNSLRQCLFNAVTYYTRGGPIGYMVCN